jgi:hypothetical protein
MRVKSAQSGEDVGGCTPSVRSNSEGRYLPPLFLLYTYMYSVVFVKSRKMTGRSQTRPLVAEGRRGKDDKKQNTSALLRKPFADKNLPIVGFTCFIGV